MRVLACTSNGEMRRGKEDLGSCFHYRGVKDFNYSNLMGFRNVSLPRAINLRTSLREKIGPLLDVGQGWLVNVATIKLLPQLPALSISTILWRSTDSFRAVYRFERWKGAIIGVEISKALPHGTVCVCLSKMIAGIRSFI